MLAGQIISGIALLIIFIILVSAIFYSILERQKIRKGRRFLITQQLGKQLQQQHQPLSKMSNYEYFDLQPSSFLLRQPSENSDLTECLRRRSVFRNWF